MRLDRTVPVVDIDHLLLRPEVRVLPPDQIDDLVAMTSYTHYEPSTIWPEVLTVSIGDHAVWLSLASIARAVFAVPALGRAIAIFDQSLSIPLRRAYFYCCDRPGAVPLGAIASMCSNHAYVCSPKEVEWHIRQPDQIAAARSWFAAYKEQTAVVAKIAEGRANNTSVNGVFIMSSTDGKCLICGDPLFGFASTTIAGVDEAKMMIVHVCQKHHVAAREHPSVLAFLCDYVGIQLPFDIKVRDQQYSGPTVQLLMDLVGRKTGASIEPLRYDEKQQYNTTIRFASGFYVKVRLKSPVDYGYVLFDPDKHQLKRIDAADHHPVVYGPSHLHLEPEVCNSNVTDSFTYGNPLLDLKLILRLVEEAERARTTSAEC